MESMRTFELKHPRSIAEATAWLASEPEARVIAGGTDLVPNLRRRIEQPRVLVDLGRVQDFASIEWNEGLALGAGVTIERIAHDAEIARRFPALSEAAASIAAPGHRAVATLGGNLCVDTRCVFYNQSEWWRASNGFCLKRGGDTCHVAPQGKRCHAAFSGDMAPALLALDAGVEVASARGVRRMPLQELYRDDGASPLTLARDELVARVYVPPLAEHARCGYRKARARGSIDFPLAGVACSLAMGDGWIAALRLALTGTNACPIVLDGTDALVGKPLDDDALAAIAKLVQKQASPMRTTVTQANYRRQVAATLARRLVQALAA